MLLPFITARAQEQERKLIDRILKPDTTIQNSSQNKKFTADKSLSNKPAHVGTFYLEKKSNAKTFSNTREFNSWQFNARSFGDAHKADISSRTTVPNSKYSTAPANNLHPVHDGAKKKETNSFAGQQAFRGQGKSQKALSQQKHAMTIDEVRELLNKNK
jgi:hypothetical protein